MNANHLWCCGFAIMWSLILSQQAAGQWDDNPQAIQLQAGPFATPLRFTADMETGITAIELAGILNSDEEGIVLIDRRKVTFNDFGDGTMASEPEPKEYVVTFRFVNREDNEKTATRSRQVPNREIYEIVFAEPITKKRLFLNLMNDGVTPPRLVICGADQPEGAMVSGPQVERVFQLSSLKKDATKVDDEPLKDDISLSKNVVQLMNGRLCPSIQINGRLGGTGGVTIDQNSMQLGDYGDWIMQTQMGYSPSRVELIERKIDDPMKQGRRLFDVRGKVDLAAGEHSCTLVVGPTSAAPHRLLIIKESKVVQVVPLIDHQWHSFAAKRQQISSVEERASVEGIRKLHGNSFVFHVQDGRVTYVNFRKQISEDALKLASRFTDLNMLRIQSCAKLSQADLDSIGMLKSLRILSLSQTPVTDQFLKTAGQLPHLSNLQVQQAYRINEMPKITDSGIESISGIKKLENLELAGLGITDRAVDLIAKHEGLKKLGLHQTSITAAGFFELHRRLPECRISLNSYDHEESESIIDISVDPDPGRIQIGAIPREEDLRELADIKTIKDVSLPRTSTDESLEIISKLVSLESLTLTNGEITNEGIAHLVHLENLQQLNLFHCKGLDDECLEYLERLSSLKKLYVSQCRISETGIERLRDKLPDCKINP